MLVVMSELSTLGRDSKASIGCAKCETGTFGRRLAPSQQQMENLLLLYLGI